VFLTNVHELVIKMNLYIDSVRLQTAYSTKQYTDCNKAFFTFKISFGVMINV